MRKLGLAVVLVWAPLAQAKVFITLEEALKSAFPGCATTAETIYLKPEQVKKAKELSEGDEPSSLLVRYLAKCAGKADAHAYADSHRVRTHPETLFFVVSGDGTLQRIEMLSFDEPLEYIPRGDWYRLFDQQKLGPELQLKRRIAPVTGASLTARATTQAARRILALDQVLRK